MLNGNDLRVTNSVGDSYGYVLYEGSDLGQPCVLSKPRRDINIPNIGSNDYTDMTGDRALSFMDWSAGAGQDSYDAEASSPSMFYKSAQVDISKKGELSLERAFSSTSSSPSTQAGKVFAACGVLWWVGQASAAFKVSSNGTTWSDVTTGTSVGIISGWCNDGTTVWVCSKGDTSDSIYKVTGSGTTWTAALYGSDGTDEKVHSIAFNGGYLYAVVEDSNAKMRVAIVDGTTGKAATVADNPNLTTPAMLSNSINIALVSAGNSVYWVTALGNRTVVYEVSYDPIAQAMYCEQYMECPTDFICTSAIGYLSAIYLAGYYWSSTSGVGQGAVYMCQDGWASPLLEIGEKPEDTPIPGDSTNNNIIRWICDAGKDLYLVTDTALYRWDIDDGGYTCVLDMNDATGSVGPTWETSDFDAADLPTFFPAGWTEDSDNLTKTSEALTRGRYSGQTACWFTGADLAVSEAHISGTMSSSNGSTFEATVAMPEAATYGLTWTDKTLAPMQITMDDGTKKARAYVSSGAIYLKDAYGRYYGHLLYGAGKFRIVLYGSYIYLYINDEAEYSLKLRAETGGTNEIRLKFLGQVDSRYEIDVLSWDWDNVAWFTSSMSTAPTMYGVAYCKGILLIAYKTSTTYYSAVMGTTTYAIDGWLQSSTTSLMSGSMDKNFRCIDVTHNELIGGASISMDVNIDGINYSLSPTVISTRRTRFVINTNGSSIFYRITLTAGTSYYSTPVVKAITIRYEFKKVMENTYILHCAAGAQTGRWKENPQDAITHLFSCADERCTCEDVFNGEYTGVIEDVEFVKAKHSSMEGYSGIVRLKVREET